MPRLFGSGGGDSNPMGRLPVLVAHPWWVMSRGRRGQMIVRGEGGWAFAVSRSSSGHVCGRR
jgi:hypothetical protein